MQEIQQKTEKQEKTKKRAEQHKTAARSREKNQEKNKGEHKEKSKEKKTSAKGFKSTYTYKVFQRFLESFTPKAHGIKFLHVFTLDLLLIAIILLLVSAAKSIGDKVLGAIIIPTDPLAVSEAQAAIIKSSMNNYYAYIILMPLALYILITLLYSLLGGFGLCIMTGQKFNKRFFLAFLAVNSIWFLLWLVLFSGVLLGLANTPEIATYFVIVLMILLFHTSTVLYSIMPFEQGIKGIKEMLRISFTKPHYLLLPYLLVFLVAQALRIADFLAKKTNNATAYFLISLTVVLIFFVWMKFYLLRMVRDIREE